MNDIIDTVAEGLDATQKQKVLVIRVMAVCTVTVLIGFLYLILGLLWAPTQYAKADDLQKLAIVVASIDATTKVNARVSLEVAITTRVRERCESTSTGERRALDDLISRLQDDYYRLTGGRYPEPGCK